MLDFGFDQRTREQEFLRKQKDRRTCLGQKIDLGLQSLGIILLPKYDYIICWYIGILSHIIHRLRNKLGTEMNFICKCDFVLVQRGTSC